MKNVVIIIAILSMPHTVMAIDFYRVVGGRAAALGRTGICEHSVWALQNNPAGIAFLRGWQSGVYYENQWLLKETSFTSGALVKEVPSVGCFGLSVCQFGGSHYSETKFGLAYARDFGPYLQVGLQAEYLLLHWGENYPIRGAPSFSLGAQSQVTEKLRLGFCLFNPIQISIKTINEDRLPTMMRFGLSYQFSDDFIGQCEAERDNSREGIRLGAGIEYLIAGKISFRAGAQSNPNILSFGVGYQLGKIQTDIAAQMHQSLGASIQFGMTIRFSS